jgi:hypothetical protein
MEVLVSAAGRRAGFGAEWVLMLARSVAPGVVIWSGEGEPAERVAAHLGRAAQRASNRVMVENE